MDSRVEYYFIQNVRKRGIRFLFGVFYRKMCFMDTNKIFDDKVVRLSGHNSLCPMTHSPFMAGEPWNRKDV